MVKDRGYYLNKEISIQYFIGMTLAAADTEIGLIGSLFDVVQSQMTYPTQHVYSNMCVALCHKIGSHYMPISSFYYNELLLLHSTT